MVVSGTRTSPPFGDSRRMCEKTGVVTHRNSAAIQILGIRAVGLTLSHDHPAQAESPLNALSHQLLKNEGERVASLVFVPFCGPMVTSRRAEWSTRAEPQSVRSTARAVPKPSSGADFETHPIASKPSPRPAPHRPRNRVRLRGHIPSPGSGNGEEPHCQGDDHGLQTLCNGRQPGARSGDSDVRGPFGVGNHGPSQHRGTPNVPRTHPGHD